MTIGDIYGLLRRLGLSADNSGFFHISYAVYLAFQQPARCLLAERWLYPVVAQQYETDCLCVERDICSVIDTLWARDPRLLKRLSNVEFFCGDASDVAKKLAQEHLRPDVITG